MSARRHRGLSRPRLLTALAFAGLLASSLTAAGAPASPRIGVAGPLSGPDAVYGAQLRMGVEQAVADIDAAGGFLGQRATVALGDDIGDPKHGADVAAGFVKDKVALVIGPFSSNVAARATPIYAGAGVLEILPAATAPGLTEQGFSTLFRLSGREDEQAAVAARYLLDRRESRVAILHDRTSVGKGLADSLRKALAAGGVKEVLYASIDKGEKDFAPLVQRIKASGARIAFWGGGPTEAGLLARELHDAGAAVTLMGGVDLASDDFATLAGPGAEGTLMLFPRDPRQRPEAADLARRLAAGGTTPDAYAFYAYAAVEVIRQAAETAGSLAPADLARVMHSGAVFHTVLGPIAFDGKGDTTRPDYTMFVWRKGPTGRIGFHELAGS